MPSAAAIACICRSLNFAFWWSGSCAMVACFCDSDSGWNLVLYELVDGCMTFLEHETLFDVVLDESCAVIL